MRVDPDLQGAIARAFSALNQQAAASSFPAPASLSQALARTLPSGSTARASQPVSQALASMFTTAAVDMWLRAVHSFLVSCSLTGVSPVWASVAGYYSSHYSVRALAHLLGFFQLFSRKRVVRLEFQAGRYTCDFNPKAANDREHRLYWKIVKRDPHFAADPFFTDNNPAGDYSDVAHRDRASYADHLSQFPMFCPLDAAAVRIRINRISDIEFTAPPIPRVSHYPDLESVQVVAYHRLVRFRDFLDTVVGDASRFWSVHRDPAWARDFVDYQLTDEAARRSEFTI
jgi:hypothetical protein